ncbi:Nucleotidylyl transferase [Pluteus cervinus]|uniref:Nucleotidylyl transferase n=1 Tax=Pluteus cervinus TaxID=181527 RepID=A0ACD3BBY1_9AGAR|nr:Nucleotidylyl transferase [Pluteus cervinus]
MLPRFPPAVLLQRLQQGLSSPPVEIVYTCHEQWPLPRHIKHPANRPLRIMVLDSSFNPPTTAHLRLACHRPPVQTDSQDTSDYDAKLLLLSVRNVDKTLKSGDATYLQRLEMMALLADEIVRYDGAQAIEESPAAGNVAVAIIDEPTFAGKSTWLRTYLQQRFASLVEDTSAIPVADTQLTFLLGFDTLERLFAPRYYGSQSQMFNSLSRFFAAPPIGDDSRVVCAYRTSTTTDDAAREAEQRTLELAKQYIDSGHISFIDIGKVESTYSSTLVRSTIGQFGTDNPEGIWKHLVPPRIADYMTKEKLYQS